MLNIKKATVLIVSALFLFFALVSQNILANVTLAVKDTVIIAIFVIVCGLINRLISSYEKKKLENKILIQYSQLLAIINSAPIMMYLKDISGKILLANQSFANIFGDKSEKIIGKNICELYKNYDVYKKEDEQIIKNKCSLKTECLIETSAGNAGWCKVIKSPVFNDSGEVVNIAVLFKNIDNEKNIEESKNTFIATLTHDLKTPTISQIKALDILLQKNLGPLNAVQEGLIMQIKSSCDYMYNLIFTILDTYLYDNGRTKIIYAKFDLLQLINETSGELANLLNEKRQNIVTLSNLKSKTVNADRFQLKRVIVNLVSNAIAYGFSDSVIEIMLDENETDVFLSVKNKANYIPQEKIINMYEKFKTASDIKFGKTGVGLGLYLSKQIVDAHMGKVYAKSGKDDTCVFGFSIPKVQDKSAASV